MFTCCTQNIQQSRLKVSLKISVNKCKIVAILQTMISITCKIGINRNKVLRKLKIENKKTQSSLTWFKEEIRRYIFIKIKNKLI